MNEFNYISTEVRGIKSELIRMEKKIDKLLKANEQMAEELRIIKLRSGIAAKETSR